MNPVPAVMVGGNARRECGRDRVVCKEVVMDLYLEFRKMIRPLIIPKTEEENGLDRFQSRKGSIEEDRVEVDGRNESVRSMATCEVW